MEQPGKEKCPAFLGDWLWDMTPEDHLVLVKNAAHKMLGDIANSEHYQRGRQSNFVEWHSWPNKCKVKIKLEPFPE